MTPPVKGEDARLDPVVAAVGGAEEIGVVLPSKKLIPCDPERWRRRRSLSTTN